MSSVLFLTHLPPYPPSSGDAARNWNLMKELARNGWDVSLFTLAPGGPLPPESLDAMRDLCHNVVWSPIAASRSDRLRRVAVSTALRRPFHLDYFWSEDAARVLFEHCSANAYDAVMMQQPYMTRYARIAANPITIFDTHNAERFRLQAMIDAGPASPRGVAARLQITPAARLEAVLARQSSRTLACSEDEYAYFDSIAPNKAALIPNGVDLEASPFRAGRPPSKRILFMGSLDYSANVDAVSTLIGQVLPLAQTPDLHLEVAGRNPPPDLKRLAATSPTTLHGFVEELQPLADSVRLMAAPIRFGGGTRLKILDAFARGIPVVSSSIGCAGVGAQDGEHLLIADTPAEFAAAIDRLMIDDALCATLAANGRRLVEQRFDWRAIGNRLDHALRQATHEYPGDTSSRARAA